MANARIAAPARNWRTSNSAAFEPVSQIPVVSNDPANTE